MQKSTVALRKAQGPADGHTDSKQAKRISTEGLSSRQRQETQASEGKSEGSSLSYTRPCSRNTNRVIHFAKNEEREGRRREGREEGRGKREGVRERENERKREGRLYFLEKPSSQ